METVAFVTQKGGTGKTTLAAALAVAAAQAGERVIALDLDPQGSLASWDKRRGIADDPLTVEQLPAERLAQLPAILAALDRKDFTLAVLDTAGVDSAGTHAAIEAADLCLLPARPSRLDIEATGITFRAVMRMGKGAAFVLNQCPPQQKSTRTSEAAAGLRLLGALAEPMMTARADHQDAMAAGLGVTEYAPDSKAAAESIALWTWVRKQLRGRNDHVVTQAAAVGN
jgi:chromosome partitioning protein